MPRDFSFCAAGNWSALASSNVNETMVPVAAALAGDAPPTPTINPTERAAARAPARNLRQAVADRAERARVVIGGVTAASFERLEGFETFERSGVSGNRRANVDPTRIAARRYRTIRWGTSARRYVASSTSG